MARFKVGDRVRVIAIRESYSESWKVGAVVTIIDVHIGKIDPLDGSIEDYTVKCIDEYEADPLEQQLEPLTDKSTELGSWKEIEETIKWNPTKKEESVK